MDGADIMGTIDTYLKKYGKYTFLEEEFNEVDATILSLISYVNFTDIVPGIKEGKILLKDAAKIYFEKNTKKEIAHNLISVRSAIYLLEKLAATKRYQNLYLYNYHYEVTFDMQFGAMCIKLPDKSVYISFEGTDSYVSGWKEDFMFSYMFPTNAQKEAVRYLNKVVGLFSPKIYVGGHSKGGNLALVASMFCKSIVRHKIKKVFNYDGPGLRKKEFESKEYKKISSKLVTYVPKSSLVGMLLRHSDNYIVVDSKNKNVMQHDATSWIVEDKSFKRTEISNFSKKIEKGVLNWLDKNDDKKREKFVSSFFSVLKKAEINDLNEFRKTKLNCMIKILKETKNLDKETRSMITTCLKDLYTEIK